MRTHIRPWPGAQRWHSADRVGRDVGHSPTAHVEASSAQARCPPPSHRDDERARLKWPGPFACRFGSEERDIASRHPWPARVSSSRRSPSRGSARGPRPERCRAGSAGRRREKADPATTAHRARTGSAGRSTSCEAAASSGCPGHGSVDLVDQVGEQRRPTRLMGCTKSQPGFSMEILVVRARMPVDRRSRMSSADARAHAPGACRRRRYATRAGEPGPERARARRDRLVRGSRGRVPRRRPSPEDRGRLIIPYRLASRRWMKRSARSGSRPRPRIAWSSSRVRSMVQADLYGRSLRSAS